MRRGAHASHATCHRLLFLLAKLAGVVQALALGRGAVVAALHVCTVLPCPACIVLLVLLLVRDGLLLLLLLLRLGPRPRTGALGDAGALERRRSLTLRLLLLLLLLRGGRWGRARLLPLRLLPCPQRRQRGRPGGIYGGCWLGGLRGCRGGRPAHVSFRDHQPHLGDRLALGRRGRRRPRRQRGCCILAFPGRGAAGLQGADGCQACGVLGCTAGGDGGACRGAWQVR